MTSALHLNRRTKGVAAISLVPLVDVLLIMLIFFMVTSRYENLGGVALVKSQSESQPSLPAPGSTPSRLLLRLDSTGVIRAPGGGDLGGPALVDYLSAHRNDRLRVLISPEARTQALVTLTEAASKSGVADLRLLRIEAAR